VGSQLGRTSHQVLNVIESSQRGGHVAVGNRRNLDRREEARSKPRELQVVGEFRRLSEHVFAAEQVGQKRPANADPGPEHVLVDRAETVSIGEPDLVEVRTQVPVHDVAGPKAELSAIERTEFIRSRAPSGVALDVLQADETIGRRWIDTWVNRVGDEVDEVRDLRAPGRRACYNTADQHRQPTEERTRAQPIELPRREYAGALDVIQPCCYAALLVDRGKREFQGQKR
jgi:hypothetical protein